MPLTRIPDFTDNDQHVLLDVLTTLVNEYEELELDIATGYFSPDVWRLISETFARLENLRLIIGKEQQLNLDASGLNLEKYYRKQVRRALEGEDFTEATHAVIDSLISFLKRESVQVKLFDDPFLHAKAYIFNNYSIVGSSNLTINGLKHNSELNMVSKSELIARAMRTDWFNSFWSRSRNYKDELIDVLDRSKFGTYQYTPFDLFIKVLYENFRESITPSTEGAEEMQAIELASFQQEGFRLAKQLLDKHGSVMIADAVGLGKTYMGLSILEEFVINRRRAGAIPKALVVCPAQLESLVWRPRLEHFGIPATVVTMESMGREDFDWKRYVNHDVIVVDESHNFRKPSTGRYGNLMKIIGSGKETKKIALLTATPINNTIFDMYHQVRLMARGREDFLSAQGIPNLQTFFKRVIQGSAEFYDLVEHTLVRRSRRDVRLRQEQGEQVIINGREIRFPKRVLHSIEYSLFDELGGFYEEFVRRIESLRLVGYNLEKYKKGRQDDTELRQREALTGIFKTNFLKRLESSLKAFIVSVENQERFQRRFYELFVQNRLLDAGTQRKIEKIMRLVGSEDDAEKLLDSYDKLLASLPQVNRNDYDVMRMDADILHDLTSLKWMQNHAEQILESRSDGRSQDAKLSAIKDLLLELKGEKVLLFNYFHDTAEYIYNGLVTDTNWLTKAGNPVIARISGSMSNKNERNILVERFAPYANKGDMDEETFEDRLKNQIQILISTDVLSEGQNLQDAGYLINTDLHWNPVRMIQRAGRIDRLGSNFEELHIYNVFPEAGLEELLGLVERLQHRISDIDRTVGLDASVLGETISNKSFEELRRIRSEDQEVLDELEQENELAVADEMRLPLIAALQALGEEYVSDIPMGIHSSKLAPVTAHSVFIALRTRDRVIWRVYPISEGNIEISKRKIYRLIEANREEPRQDTPRDISIFPFLERAISETIKESKKEIRRRGFKAPLRGKMKLFHDVLDDMFAIENLDSELRLRLIMTIEERNLSAFENDNDLKLIWETYQVNNDLESFALELDAFFTTNRLHTETDPNKEMLEVLRENDIQLIAYEWLS